VAEGDDVTETREVCNTCVMTARYTTSDGRRACGLCAMRGPSVRDTDVPDLVGLVHQLLDELDKQIVTAGTDTRQQLRNLVGRRLTPTPETP
jgi:hypothetical protein